MSVVTKKIIPLNKWFKESKNLRPYLISGPCSAESEEQLVSTAKLLQEHTNINMLRAGIWKPRTRPNSFEGVGADALNWLKTASKAIDVPCCTEVANTKHVEACLKAGVDVLWLGARTVVSPFAVQEIADALKGIDIPIMVKNPVNPDFKLWVGAIERIQNSGVNKIAAIHRGFSWFDNTPYRNAPRWSMAIELKTIFPDLNIICDPSHIAGKRNLIHDISQKALDLEMDGLMIESHINPDEALSDASQQVTPQNLGQILDNLNVRDSGVNSLNQELKSLRAIIDEIDHEILRKIKDRMQIVEKIGAYKKKNKVTILQLERWKEILESRTNLSNSLSLNLDFTKKYLEVLHEESIRLQTQIMNMNE